MIADGVQVRAAVVVDHALGVAGSARSIEQRERLPFVLRLLETLRRIAFGQERLVVQIAEQFASLRQRVIDIDDQRRGLAERQGLFHDR